MNAPYDAPSEAPTSEASSEAGFSLIEVMVALFIFALISTGTAYTVLTVLQLDRDSRARHVAVNLAAQEIDLARDAGDLLTLVDVVRPAQLVGGNNFYVTVTTAWVSATGTDDACGTTGGTLLTKRINVEVRWDNQRAGSSPVRADTVITPNSHLNSPDRGTILVRVLGVSGAGVSGVGITAVPSSVAHGASGSASATTDAQGCAFLPRLTPGNYDVTASAAGHIDSKAQAASPVVTVALVAGYSAGAAFSYDRASTFTLTYAPATIVPAPTVPEPTVPAPTVPAPTAPAPTVPAATVYLPRNLHTSFVPADGGVILTELVATGTGTGTNTTRERTTALFPFSSGYEVIAGRYVAATSTGTAPTTPVVSCLSPDPAAWAPVVEAGVTLSGTRVKVASGPGQSDAKAVPMGILTVTGLTSGANLTAESTTAAAATGDPGCAQATTYNFGAVPTTSTIALPFGSWTLHSGSTTVPASAITLASRGVVSASGGSGGSGATVTLDPRVGPTP
jgi:prepilin-type N-terminal cleavage/methylation domain-containing protein